MLENLELTIFSKKRVSNKGNDAIFEEILISVLEQNLKELYIIIECSVLYIV